MDTVSKAHTWLGGRLKMELLPATKSNTEVSQEWVNGFKEWLGQ